jgi:hypothetical protein
LLAALLGVIVLRTNRSKEDIFDRLQNEQQAPKQFFGEFMQEQEAFKESTTAKPQSNLTPDAFMEEQGRAHHGAK